jgi:hypothetical protein
MSALAVRRLSEGDSRRAGLRYTLQREEGLNIDGRGPRLVLRTSTCAHFGFERYAVQLALQGRAGGWWDGDALAAPS